MRPKHRRRASLFVRCKNMQECADGMAVMHIK
ncbi:hypothetical protein NGR_c15640 [Sinorhizobium fredii NGR234]|uniref:Uncharacterized protein n=1 Tax=Sinorhizobium fredii (strain NBRC 101917 / NGR234) TaxID=394 RepID=C3MD11_SINFN|nr:hypothetical protein NGR_c15640 [Sinorhizobium fredii NGR234]